MSTSKIIFLSLVMIFPRGSEKDTSLLKEPWSYYYKRGMLQYRAEMYDYSLDSLKKALRKKPDLYQAANTLGHIFLLQEKSAEALESFERSLKIKKNQPDILCETALLHEFFAHYDKALQRLKDALTTKPEHVKSHAHIVRFLYRAGKPQKAREHLARSIALGKIKGKIYMDRARRAEAARKYDLALKLYGLALKESPAWTRAHLRIYEIYRMQKKFPDAVKALEKFVHLVPFHERARIYLGHLYFAKKLSKYRRYNIRRAITHLEKAAELNPGNPETFHVLSDIYLFIGDDVKGKKYKKQAYSLEEK